MNFFSSKMQFFVLLVLIDRLIDFYLDFYSYIIFGYGLTLGFNLMINTSLNVCGGSSPVNLGLVVNFVST